jgi:hypothetical protein
MLYVSDSSVVSMVTRFSVNFSRMQSPSGRSIIYGCSKYGLSIDEFFNMPTVSLAFVKLIFSLYVNHLK